MKIVQTTQGTAQWLTARLGVVTASEAGSLFTDSMTPRKGAGVETYIVKKLAEKFYGYGQDFAQSFAMGQGQLNETVALPWYEFAHGPVERVGLCTTDDGKCGASPDGLLGGDGGLEVKCPQPNALIEYLLSDEAPACFMPQIHFSLWVTGRAWWKLLVFSRQHLPSRIWTIQRDPEIMATIGLTMAAFLPRLDAKYATLCAMRDAENETNMAKSTNLTGTRGD